MNALISAHTRGWGAWTWTAYLEDGRTFEDGRADQLAAILRRAGVGDISIAHAREDAQPIGPRLRHAMLVAWDSSVCRL